MQRRMSSISFKIQAFFVPPPAITAQVLRSLCGLFLYACGKAEPFRMASAFALAIFSGNIIFMFVFRK